MDNNEDDDDATQHLLSTSIVDDVTHPNNHEKRRNLVAFWIIGLCNNFGYVVMLSAAYDILKEQKGGTKPTPNTTITPLVFGSIQNGSSNNTGFHCNQISTGLVLLADILPSLAIKLTAPFYMQRLNYHLRIGFVMSSLVISLLILAFSSSVLVSILAVVLASISSGLGEITFLSLTSHFNRSTVSAWSSGTGMSGVTGAVAYAGLLQIGFSKRNSVLFLLIVPFIFAISVWIVLEFPSTIVTRTAGNNDDHDDENTTVVVDGVLTDSDRMKYMSLKTKLNLIVSLRKYMFPLFLVYLAEYTINQGLYELLYFDVSWLTQAEQYRWFQVDYQIAVFVSRSSVYVFHIKNVMLLSVLQCIVFAVLLLEVCYTFLHYIWIALGLVFLEGLIGGAVYVNTFFRMSKEIERGLREFSLGAVSVSDSFGISIAGAIALPLHNALCKLKKS